MNDAFVSRREIMDREMMGQVLDDLIPGDSTEIDDPKQERSNWK